MTKYRLAKLSGISQTYIYRLEMGEIKNPRRDTLQKLSHGLGVTLAYLIAETPPSETWQLLDHYWKAYIPVYPSIDDRITPVDYVVYTTVTTTPDTIRAYRSNTLHFDPQIKPNDTVIVDTALQPRNHDLLIAINYGQPLIVRYRQDRHADNWFEDNQGRMYVERMDVHGVITNHIHTFR